MRSLTTMQACTLTPPFGHQAHTPGKTTSSNVPVVSPQMKYYIVQQTAARQRKNPQSPGSCHGYASTQSVSSSSDLHPREMPQVWCTLPKGQYVSWPASKHGTTTQNISHYPQTVNRNPVPQTLNGNSQNCNMPPMLSVSDVPASCLLANQAARIQEQTRVQENSTLYNTVDHILAQSQRLGTPSQPSNTIQQTGQHPSGYNTYQVQHASHNKHYPLTKHNGNKHPSLTPNQPFLPRYESQHLIIPATHQNQRMNQSSGLSAPRDQVQPQTPRQQRNTMQVSGPHSKTYHPTRPAVQGNMQAQSLQSNNRVAVLPSSSQGTISTSTSSPFVYPESSGNTFLDLLLNSPKVPAQRHDVSPLSYHKAVLTTPEQTPNGILTKAGYYQTPESPPSMLKNGQDHQRVTEYQTPVKRTAVLKETEQNQLNVPDVQCWERMQSRRLQTNTERKDAHESDNRQLTREVQYIEDTAESLELAMALNQVFRQSNKAVAVVPPIYQQVLFPENSDHVTTSSVCPPTKENKTVEEESNASSTTKEATEEFCLLLKQLLSVAHPETQKRNELKDGATVDSQTPNAQSTEVPRSKIGSTKTQSPDCSTVLTSKSPEDLDGVRTEKSDAGVFDLPKIHVDTFTLEKLKYLVKVFERVPEEKVKEPVADFEKCLLDLYWAGNLDELFKQMHTFPAKLCDFYCKMSTKETEATAFQFLSHKYVQKLEHFCHVLKHDTVLPTEEFRSSWLNVDGQPADIENVLAEPISDFKLPDYVLHKGFDTFDISLESDPSTKVIPANAEYQSGTIMTKDFANSQECKSPSADKIPATKEASSKQVDENLEKNQQQVLHRNSEENIDSSETAVVPMESGGTAECEQVPEDASESIISLSEGIEPGDLSHDTDISNNSESIEVSLLSSDDARAVFKECFGSDRQKQPSQLCQDETKVSATPDNESFHSSANQIIFTCPHVTDFESDGENFCSKCWEETPLLDLDLEEDLFSPKCDSPRSPKHSWTPSETNCIVVPESSDVTDAPPATVDVDEWTSFESDSNPSDEVESCSSGSGKSPVEEPHVPVFTESINFTLLIDTAVCETNQSVEPELPKAIARSQNTENLVIPEQTKTRRDDISPPESPPCKKLKGAEITEAPASDLFTADDVTTKASSSKTKPSDLRVTPAEDGHNCKYVRKEKGEKKSHPIKLKILLNTQSPQSGKPDPVFSESIIDSSNSSACGFTTTTTEPDPNLRNSIQSCISPSAKPDSQALTKAPMAKVSPPRYTPWKKLKHTKVASLPPEDELFTPDIVIKKASSPKSRSSDLNVSSTEGGQHCKDKGKEKENERKSKNMSESQHNQQSGEREKACFKSQVPTVTPQPKRPAAASISEKNREKVESTTKQTGQNKETKQRFALYGSNNGHRNKMIHHHNCRTKPITAPVYVTISDARERSMNYTDTPSAKQKVYSLWSSTFVEPKKKTPSHKKHRKNDKVALDSMTQALKRHLKDREAIQEKQKTKDAEDFHKCKKVKAFHC